MTEARRTIETAFERGGVNDTNIVVSYAGFLSAYGEFDEALALLSDHKPAENNQKNYLYNLGDVHLKLGQYEASEAAFRKTKRARTRGD